jgi:hypothetical protein
VILTATPSYIEAITYTRCRTLKGAFPMFAMTRDITGALHDAFPATISLLHCILSSQPEKQIDKSTKRRHANE